MATVWRPAHDPLSRYLASVDDDAASSGGATAVAFDEDEEHEAQEEAVPAPSSDDAAGARSWARWRGRLARHGILVAAVGAAGASVNTRPPPAAAQAPEALLTAVLAYHLALRAAIRQLHGPLALLCGRGVAVPMPPLTALLLASGDATAAAAEAEAHCPALPALRAALVG